MSVVACALLMLLAEVPFCPAWAMGVQISSPQQATTSPETGELQDVEQSRGPFSLVGNTFTIVLRSKRLRAASDSTVRLTLAALEIRDKSGAVLYRKVFPYEVRGGTFRQSVSASTRLVSGGSFAALLIHYVTVPAAPADAESWQLFHFLGGRLVLFDQPVSAAPKQGPYGGFVALSPNGVRPAGFGVQGDLIELRVWTGNFYVLLPLRVDWQHNRLTPGEECFEMHGGSLREIGCDLRVEAEYKSVSPDMGFVRLFHDATENEYNVRHLVLNKDAKIEFLGAKAIATWNAAGDAMKVRLSDLWLKVLIDDNDDNLGWIHTDEDFTAVGLPSGSPGP
jgi:hypothetical protein